MSGGISGYGEGSVDTILTAEQVAREAADFMAQAPSRADLLDLAGPAPLLVVEDLVAGYGRMEIVHGIDMAVGAGQSLCLVGPNGAGKSSALNALFGLNTIMSGRVTLDGRDITRMAAGERLRQAGLAYILQDNSIFPQMSVEENLLVGGHLLPSAEARRAVDRVFSRYERLARRRQQRAGVLSGGERRLLEICRALIMEPRVLLVDEPSIGLEPRFIDMVFEILSELQRRDGKTIIIVEQNAKKGLEFADLGYVLVSGQLARAGRGADLLADPLVRRLFLGG